MMINSEEQPLLAWSLDNAVNIFGNWIEAKLNERVGGKGRHSGDPKWRPEQLLRNPESVPSRGAPVEEDVPARNPGKFGSLASMANVRTMKTDE
jgi:hypothetical protein